MSLINTEIKPFNATAYHNGKFVPVSSEDLKGKWSVVVFYPADFTFVCPTELGDLADHYDTFKALGVEVTDAMDEPAMMAAAANTSWARAARWCATRRFKTCAPCRNSPGPEDPDRREYLHRGAFPCYHSARPPTSNQHNLEHMPCPAKTNCPYSGRRSSPMWRTN